MPNRATTGVAAAAIAAATLATACSHSAATGLPRKDSVVVTKKSDTTIPSGPVPSTYHVVYDVTDRAGRAPATSTREEDWVRRPFDGRREVAAGAKVTQVSVWSFGRFEVKNVGAASAQTLQIAPASPGNDLRPDTVRADAIKAAYFTPMEQRRVGAHRCQVYRTLQGAQAGPLEPTERNGDAYSDLCFDRRGLLIEEVGYDHDRVVHRKVLRSAEVGVTIDDSRFAFTGTDLTLQKGGGSVRAVDPASRPPGDPFLELDGPPAGFDLRGRYAVVPPQPEAFSDPTKYDTRQAGIVDVYTRGTDFLLVDRGGTIGGSDAFQPEPTSNTADLGTLGRGEILLGMTGSQLRVLQPGGHYVRVSGTAPAADLVALAKRLTPQPAGELRFLDGQG